MTLEDRGREDDVVSLDDFDEPPPYVQEFCSFIDEACTTYHAAAYFKRLFDEKGFVQLKESENWLSILKPGGNYYVTRNSSSVVAFSLGPSFAAGDPWAMIGTHIDALCMKVKPYSKKNGKGGWERLGVAPYGGGGASQKWDGSFSTWWDRDLGCGGRVLVKGAGGKVEEKLIRMPGAVARIPTLAVHFGAPALGPFNYETNMVPILGLEDADSVNADKGKTSEVHSVMGKNHSSRFLRAIASATGQGVTAEDILDFSLELFDNHPSTLLGLSSEFISAPRMDDRLCSYAAGIAFLNASTSTKVESGARLVAMFDTEEVGSVLRQGAKSNFIKSVIERVVEAFAVKAADGVNGAGRPSTFNVVGETLARSFFLSADVTHADNPNFDGVYLEGASPILNKGPCMYMDPNGHMTSNAVSATLFRAISEKVGPEGGEIQLLYPRSDSRTGGTIGPMTSQELGVPAIDLGIPMMSMHSIRALTGAKDVGLAVKLWEGYYNLYLGDKSLRGMVEGLWR